MLNYIKFAVFQIVGFLLSIFKLKKYLKFPSNVFMKEKYSFLHNHASKSLDIVNININTVGTDLLPKEPVLFISNHSSMLDSYILVACIDKPIGFVIADEPIWKNMPIVSKWAKLIQCVYINRKNNREGLKSIIQASKNIKNNQNMVIFPEGDLTWVKDKNALISEFKTGALKIAYKAKCPIVPVVIKNSKNTYSGYKAIGKIKSANIEVEFLNPVYDHIKNPKIKTLDLSNKIRKDMLESIKKSYI